MSYQEFVKIILLLLPILLIQLGLAIYALIDLSKREQEQVKGPRWVWALVLILTSLALPTGIVLTASYLVWGRNAS